MRSKEKMNFDGWIADGNALIVDNAWSTQDSQWSNRFDTKAELFAYYLKEFFGLNPAQYFFLEMLPYMRVESETSYALKYNHASEWVVNLFKTTLATKYGRFNSGDLVFDMNGMKFRLEKEFGRFGRYGKLYMTLEGFECIDDFLNA
jgi:hypothetical protein